MRTKSFAKSMEAWGLLIALCAFAFEAVYGNYESDRRQTEFTIVNEKLDQLHHRQFQLQVHIDSRTEQIHQGRFVKMGDPVKPTWDSSPSEQTLATYKSQGYFFRAFRVAVFILVEHSSSSQASS